MKKLLSILIATSLTLSTSANTMLETYILKSNYTAVKGTLTKMGALESEDKSRLSELANDIIMKRNTNMLHSTDINDAVNDYKRYARSGSIMTLGAVIFTSFCALTIAAVKQDTFARNPRNNETTVIASMLGAGLLTGALTYLKGMNELLTAMSIDTEEKKEKYKKKSQKLIDAILVKQLILKA